MANEQNLIPFTKDNQPPGAKKSRKGIPNRDTIWKTILKMKLTDKTLEELGIPQSIAGEIEKIPLYQAMTLGQAISAIKGNTKAFQEAQDSMFGKLTDKMELEHSGDLSLDMTLAIDSVYGEKEEKE